VTGTTLGLASGVLVLAAGGAWYRRAMAIRIPDDKRGFLGAMAVAVVLGVCAFASGVGVAGGIGAGLGVSGGGIFLFLNAFSRQARPVPAVAVGRPLLAVQAPTDTGTPFDVSSLRGTPLLLKFFRGHW
jgi:hypothetical protein